jgi:hypothetical protein
LKSYALLAVLESALAFYILSAVPSAAENAVIAGYSASRLLLLAGAALPLFVFGSILVATGLSATRLDRVTSFTDALLTEKWKRISVIAVSSLLSIVGIILLITPPARLGDFASFAERLAPLVHLGGLLGVQTLLGQFLWRGGKFHFQNLHQWKPIFTVVIILLALAAVVAVWAAWSGIGLKPEKYGWHRPGTPIPFSQVLIALFVSALFMFFKDRIKNISPSFKFEALIFLSLWLAAFLIWQAEPMRRQSYFTPAPTPPNFESYPYSDAGFYDTLSQNILIGQGRTLEVILRPLYIFFLTALHLISGQDYNLILTLQTMTLALMPPLAFLLVSRMGSQWAGILSALLLIFREKNSIALTNILEVSHSKLLLSDLPTTMLMLLMVYTLVNWLRRKDIHYPLGLVSGAAFGLVVLVRSQAQLLLPILLVGIVFSGGFQWRKALQRTAIFVLGLLIVVTPWVWRNYQVSGKPVVENTDFYIRMLAGGYVEPTGSVDRLPDESLDEYSARMKSQMVRYVLDHPLEIARVYSTYFIHNEISSVVYLPMSFRLYDLYSYVKQLPFWDGPYIDLGNSYGVMFFLTLGLIALGVGASFQRLGFLGLFPLLIHFTYSFSVVTARISGWRFILPVDWIPQVYYSIGLIQLIWMIASVIWNKRATETEEADANTNPSFFQRRTYVAMAGFLIVGLSLPVMELSLPVRYPTLPPNDLIKDHAVTLQLDDSEQVTASALKSFLETEPGAMVAYGRALYPSYYEEGYFWGESSPNLVAASRFNRLQFMLIGPDQGFTFIPVEEAPQYFPHAADVFVVGCRGDGFIRALLVKVNDQMLVSSTWHGLTCSEME